MKKAFVVALILAMALSVTAFAGALFNLSFSPIAEEASLALGVGYRINGWSFIAKKADFSEWTGDWSFGFFWEKGGYKIGPVIDLSWTEEGIEYSNMIIVLGASWVVSLGDVLNPTAYIQLGFLPGDPVVITPTVGFELEFDMFSLDTGNW